MLVSYSLLTNQLTLKKNKLLYKSRKRLLKKNERPILMSETLKIATSEISITRTKSTRISKNINFLKLLSFLYTGFIDFSTFTDTNFVFLNI